jgi:hypothetical protein
VVRGGVVYWLSFRTQQPAASPSFDALLAPEYSNQVFIHRWTTPSNTMLVATLGPRQTFTDAATGLRVAVASMGSPVETAKVWLDGWADTCVPQPPVVTLKASASSLTSAGCLTPQTLAFEVGAGVWCLSQPEEMVGEVGLDVVRCGVVDASVLRPPCPCSHRPPCR